MIMLESVGQQKPGNDVWEQDIYYMFKRNQQLLIIYTGQKKHRRMSNATHEICYKYNIPKNMLILLQKRKKLQQP